MQLVKAISLLVAIGLTTPMAAGEHPPAPKITPLLKFFESDPNLAWAYGFSTIRDSSQYRTWFFAPAPPAASRLHETIYSASTPIDDMGPLSMSFDAWEVFTGAQPDRYPYDAKSGHPKQFQPMLDHAELMYVGDPSVIKLDSRYYMLYSGQEYPSDDPQHKTFHVYGAESTDGIHWIGQKQMWFGHRPSLLHDGEWIHCWYDTSNGPRYKKSMRTDDIGRFLESGADGVWDKEQQLIGIAQNNIEVIRRGDHFFAVSDGGSPDHVTVDGWYSKDGINFTPYGPIATVSDLPEADRSQWNSLDVPQLFVHGNRCYLMATAKTGHAPKRTYLFSLEFAE